MLMSLSPVESHQHRIHGRTDDISISATLEVDCVEGLAEVEDGYVCLLLLLLLI